MPSIRGDLIVIDFGTATTFDVVDGRAPTRAGSSRRASTCRSTRWSAAAKLPRIAIEAPDDTSVIGRTTESKMNIGIYWGYVAMIEGLTQRLKGEIVRPVTVVATGGLAALFDKHTKAFDAIEPDLTFRG